MFHIVRHHRFVFIGLLFAALGRPAMHVPAADVDDKTPERVLAKKILDATNFNGGLVVHLGCGDGKLTASLGADRRCLVQGLDVDAGNVRQARANIQQHRAYGSVSARQFDGKRLPYADNLVNLVVAEDLGGVTTEEAMRVLAPGDTLYIKQNGKWQKTFKPRPANIDEWTHYLHDAGGNAVARDQVVGPPARLQWRALPRHTRSHEHIPSIYALVSAGGRIFYIVDEAPTASIGNTPQWRLVARDAFNGVLLWKKPVGRWYPHIVNWGRTPRQLQRRLVAVDDRVYVTLGLHAPLSVLDAATGETLKEYANTRGAEEVICHDGVILLAVRNVTGERIAELARWKRLVASKGSPVFQRETAESQIQRLRTTEAKGEKSVLAFAADTAKLLWSRDGPDVSGLRPDTLSAFGDGAFYQNGTNVVCVDLKTGKERWSAAAPPLFAVCEEGAFCADGKTITALSRKNGKTRWTQGAALCQIRDVFVAGGSLWIGGFKPFQGRSSGRRGPAWGPYFVTQRDVATGKILRRIEPDNPSHHHRCYRNKATDRFILAGRRGTEFIDLNSGDVLWNSWARGVCRYGVMPCNGLLYAPSHACGCYITAKTTGFNALAPAGRTKDKGRRTKDEGRLVKGPAFGKTKFSPSSLVLRTSEDWPTYRHDARRSGGTASPVSSALRRRWQLKVGDRLTAPTVSDGKVFAASVDEHRLCALDANSGKPIWQFIAGGRVDSPPTLHQGRAIFGCRDGSVYSLRTSDGTLAWRLETARADRCVVVNGQLESVSPVHGSVLVAGETAYFTAGRSSYMDGGIDLYRIQPGGGKVLSTTSIYSPDPKTGRQPPQSAPATMPGARSDILAGDDRYIYLRNMAFDRQGAKQPQGNDHLFTLTDYLDDTWTHRWFWMFGKRPSISTGCSGRDRKAIFGRMLVFDDSTIFGYGRSNIHWSNQLQDGGYRLFAVKRGQTTAKWTKPLPMQARAMLLAGRVLFLAGATGGEHDFLDKQEEPRTGLLVAISTSDGTRLARYPLDRPPVFNGMASARGRLYVALENGDLVCMEEVADE